MFVDLKSLCLLGPSINKIDSEHTRAYRFLPVCEDEILRVTVKRIEVFSSFMLISDDFG